MKKNDLIKLLEEIKGNPEVVLWNPYVEDYNPVLKVATDVLYKESLEHIFNMLRAQSHLDYSEQGHTEDDLNALYEEAKRIHSKRTYDFPNPFVTEEELHQWYQKKTKKVIIIEPRKVGKTSYGRSSRSDISY